MGDVVYDDEMDLEPMRKLDTAETVESGNEGMQIALDMFVIVLENAAEEFVFVVVDRLDDETVIAGKVKDKPDSPGEPSSNKIYFAVREKR